MSEIIQEIQSIYSLLIGLIIIGIGLFTMLVDQKRLRDRKMDKEAVYAKWIGYIYVIIGVLGYFTSWV